MPANLERIMREVAKSGLPSELAVEAQFRTRNWDVVTSVLYLDPQTNENRELDIHAVHSEAGTIDERPVHVEIQLLVEVKKSDKPWVIFCSKPTATEISGMSPGQRIADAIDLRNRYHLLPDRFPPGENGLVGRSAMVAHDGGDRAIYGSINAAVQATEQTRRATHSQFYRVADGPKPRLLVFFHPVIVLDGDLVQASLQDARQVELAPMTRCLTRVGRLDPSRQLHPVWVHIVTIENLNAFLASIEHWLHHLALQVPDWRR